MDRLRHFLIAVLAAGLAPAPASADVTVAERLAPGQPPVVSAHRARGGDYPENSLSGIRHALDIGAEMIRIDVQMTRDGRYVVMHDPTLNRTTDVVEVFPEGPPGGPSREARGGRDYIRDYTLDEIGRLALTDGEDGGKQGVPTLEAALDAIGSEALVMLGLKLYDVDSLAALLNARETANVILQDSFYSDPGVLREITAATGIAADVGIKDQRDYLAALEALAEGAGPSLTLVSVYAHRVTPEFVTRTRELGLGFSIYGIEAEDAALGFRGDPAPWQEAIGTGAIVLTTAFPEELMRLLGR